MNCPYCKKELDNYFYPNCSGNNHYYEINHGNELLELFAKFVFYKGDPPAMKFIKKYVIINDFEILNDKTSEEIEELYNKLNIFS